MSRRPRPAELTIAERAALACNYEPDLVIENVPLTPYVKQVSLSSLLESSENDVVLHTPYKKTNQVETESDE